MQMGSVFCRFNKGDRLYFTIYPAIFCNNVYQLFTKKGLNPGVELVRL